MTSQELPVTRRDEEADELEESMQINSILCCIWSQMRLGIAVYRKAADEIYALQTTDEGEGAFNFQSLRLAKLQVQPEVIYTNSQADLSFIQELSEPYEKLTEDGNLIKFCPQIHCHAFKLLTMYSSDPLEGVHAMQAMSSLMLLNLPGLSPSSSSQERMHIINSMLNLSLTQQVCATGALIAILIKEEWIPEMQRNNGFYTFKRLSEFVLEGCLTTDRLSLMALQIFQASRHSQTTKTEQRKES